MAEEGLALKDFEKYQRENLIGTEVLEQRVPEPFPLDWIRVQCYCNGLSDDNPLYHDPAYGPKTRWGGQLAPPSIISSLRYPQPHTGAGDKPWKVINFVGGSDREWVDVFRAGDSYTTSLVLKELYTKSGSKGELLFMVTEGGCWNQHGNLVGKQHGTQVQVAKPEETSAGGGGFMLYDRSEPYKYSPEEIKEITDAYDTEVIRGSKPLYWEEVNEGDKLLRIARGPLTIQDQIRYRAINFSHGIGGGQTFKIWYKLVKNMPPFSRHVNPATNWPYEGGEAEHDDTFLVKARGLGLPFDRGVQRMEMSATVITNWMGDGGFLRRLSAQVRKPCLYGDTTWFSGEVVKKYKVTEGGVEYGAVDIKIDGVNQLGEMTLPATATVYLPSPGCEVTVPIPVKVDVVKATK